MKFADINQKDLELYLSGKKNISYEDASYLADCLFWKVDAGEANDTETAIYKKATQIIEETESLWKNIIISNEQEALTAINNGADLNKPSLRLGLIIYHNKAFDDMPKEEKEALYAPHDGRGNIHPLDCLLFRSIHNKLFKVAKFLIQHIDNDMEYWEQASHYLIENANIEQLKFILDQKENLAKETPGFLFKAIQYGNTEIVEPLLDNGADINSGSKTPLCYAAEKKNKEMVELLLNKGADVNKGSKTPLCYATKSGFFSGSNNKINIVESLLNKGATVNSLDDESLHNSAGIPGSLDMFTMLLDKVVNKVVEITNKTNIIDLVIRNHPEWFEVCLNKGVIITSDQLIASINKKFNSALSIDDIERGILPENADGQPFDDAQKIVEIWRYYSNPCIKGADEAGEIESAGGPSGIDYSSGDLV